MEGLAWLTVNPIVVIFSRDLLSISLRSIELYQGNGNRQLGGQTSNSNILQVSAQQTLRWRSNGGPLEVENAFG